MKRFNLRKLNGVEVIEHFSYRFATSENFLMMMMMMMMWTSVGLQVLRVDVKASAKESLGRSELKQHKL